MSDSLSFPFPSLVEHTKYLSSASCGSIVHGNTNLVSSDGNEVSRGSYVRDAQSLGTTEVCRDQVCLSVEENTGEMSFGVLHEVNTEESGLVKTIQPVVHTTTERTTLTSVDSVDVCRLTFDGSISWNKNEACLYLSSNRVFRFRFIESDGISPSRLAIQGLNEETGEYTSKVEFSTD